MSKLTITIGKGDGALNITAAKSAMRDKVYSVIMNALAAEFGAEGAGMVRIPSGSDATKGDNVPAVICADINEDGGTFDGCVTVKVTVKDWNDRVGTKTVKPAWDYYAARKLYDDWVVMTEAKAAEKAAANAAKAKADAEARAKRKAEAEARKKSKG